MDFFFEDHTKNPFEKYLAFLEADDEDDNGDEAVNMEVRPDGRLHDYKNDVEADETISPDTVEADEIDADDTDLTPDTDDENPDDDTNNNPDTDNNEDDNPEPDVEDNTTDGEGNEDDNPEPDVEDNTTDGEGNEDDNPEPDTGEDTTADGDEIDVDGEDDDLSVDDDAPDETGGEDTGTDDNDTSGKKERTDESLLKYSLFLDMKKLYNAIKSYYTRLEGINETNINYGMVTKTCTTNLHQLEDMVYDFMTIRFIDESYVTCKLFYEKVITSIGLIFDMLEQNSKLVI